MIYFNINIRNPFWGDRWESLKHWSCKEPKNHKSWEIQTMKDSELFRIEFDWTARQDHAGVRLELGLFGYKINFSYYDTRHWHPEKDRWIDYSDPKELEELYGEAYTGKKK